VTNLPDHASAKIGDIRLSKVEGLLPTRQRLQELAGEHPTVIAVLLLRRILQCVTKCLLGMLQVLTESV
jgi:hypothetical protein